MKEDQVISELTKFKKPAKSPVPDNFLQESGEHGFYVVCYWEVRCFYVVCYWEVRCLVSKVAELACDSGSVVSAV